MEEDIRLRLNSLMSNMVSLISNGDLFEFVPMMAILFESSTGTIIKANKKFLAYLGYTKEEIVNKTFFDLCSDLDLERTRIAHEEYLKGLKPTTFFKNHYKHKDGSLKPIYWFREDASKSGLDNYSFSFAISDLTIADN